MLDLSKVFDEDQAKKTDRYPYGEVINFDQGNNIRGFPIDARFFHDVYGWMQALVIATKTEPNEKVEDVKESDILTALRKLIDTQVAQEKKITETKIAQVKKLIDTQVAQEKKITETKIAQVRKLIDTQIAQVKKLIDTQVAQEKKITETKIAQVRKLIDTQIAQVKKLIDTQVAQEKKITETPRSPLK